MTGKNRSSAVMQQRQEARDALDDFPTPPWATRALLREMGEDHSAHVVREPAANRGHMVRPLAEAFNRVLASDVHDYGAGFPVEDYLIGRNGEVDWVITNPPFRLAEDFIVKALNETRIGVAVFVRSAFLEGIERYRSLFRTRPPWAIYQFAERVVIHKGKLAPKGSTATAYCWVVWRHCCEAEPFFRWIPPCRREMERAGDYPAELPDAQSASVEVPPLLPVTEEAGAA